MEIFKERCRSYLYFFNYTDHPEEGQADPSTTFFTYDRQTKHDASKLETFFNGYKKVSQDALTQVIGANGPETERPSFAFNESFPVEVKNTGNICDKITINEPKPNKKVSQEIAQYYAYMAKIE